MSSDSENDGWQIAFVKLSKEKDENGCKSVEGIRLENDFTLLDLIKMRKIVFEQSLWNMPKPRSEFEKSLSSSKNHTAAKRGQDALEIINDFGNDDDDMDTGDKTSKKRRKKRRTQEQLKQDSMVFFKTKDYRKNPEIGLIITRYMLRSSKRRTLPSATKQRVANKKKADSTTTDVKTLYNRKWILHPNVAEQFKDTSFSKYEQVDPLIKNAILSGSAQDLNIKPIEKQIAELTSKSLPPTKSNKKAGSKDNDSDGEFVVNDNYDMDSYESNIRSAQQDQQITYPVPQNMIKALNHKIDHDYSKTKSKHSHKKSQHTKKMNDIADNSISDDDDQDDIFAMPKDFCINDDDSDSSYEKPKKHKTTITTAPPAKKKTSNSKSTNNNKKRKRSLSPAKTITKSNETASTTALLEEKSKQKMKNHKNGGTRSLFENKLDNDIKDSDNSTVEITSNNTNVYKNDTKSVEEEEQQQNYEQEVILNVLPPIDPEKSIPLVLSQPNKRTASATTTVQDKFIIDDDHFDSMIF
jgi:hypothetical protein